MPPILVVGGFGASPGYFSAFAAALRAETGRAVLVLALRHGLSLEDECEHALARACASGCLPPAAPPAPPPPAVLLGFSTGCVVAAALAARYAHRLTCAQLILCNPADVMWRMSAPFLRALVPAAPAPLARLARHLPLMRRGSGTWGEGLWRALWPLLGAAWGAAQQCMGPLRCARIYYHLHARHVNEPHAEELSALVFRTRLADLRTTVVECLVHASLAALLRQLQGIRVFIVAGREDFYRHFSCHLAGALEHASLHRTRGDHHMLYHHPRECALRVAALLRGRQRRLSL